MDLRDFESILIFFREEEIEALLVAIEERRSRRLAHSGEGFRAWVEQPVYSSCVGESGFSEVRIHHPA
jgi:hypothetical protein